LILYLHDTPYKVRNEVAANIDNIDTVELVESCLVNNKNLMLSADDGYKSVINLLPLLEKYNVRLLFFVTTGLIEKTVYPYEVEISNFLEKNSSCKYSGETLELEGAQEKDDFFKALHQRLKYLSLEQRDYLVHNFFSENGTNRNQYQKNVFMTWDDLLQIKQHPLVEIGSHCVSHIFLPSQTIADIYYELRESKERLEEKLECKVTKLSYPYGGNDLKVRLLARLAGYKEAYGTHNKKSKAMNQARIGIRALI